VSERNIDAVTGLSGPMPAYLYLVVEALIEPVCTRDSRATSPPARGRYVRRFGRAPHVDG